MLTVKCQLHDIEHYVVFLLDGYPEKKEKDKNTIIMVAEEEKRIHVLQPVPQYALGQTSHLKRRRQQESIAACQP